MEEKLDTANAELDQLDAAETDLATQVHAAVDTIAAEAAAVVDLTAQVKALTDAASAGSAIMPSTVAALNARIVASLGTIQTQAAALKSALPPAPVVVAPVADANPPVAESAQVPS